MVNQFSREYFWKNVIKNSLNHKKDDLSDKIKEIV